MSLPTRRWYISLFTATSSLVSLSLWIGSIVVPTGLHINFSVSLRRLIKDFCLEKKIRYLECATLIPRKYFKLPNSLISNSLVKHCLKVYLSFSSFPIMMMSSTYTNKVVTPPKSKCLMNNTWSPWLCMYPMFFITLANLQNHALETISAHIKFSLIYTSF